MKKLLLLLSLALSLSLVAACGSEEAPETPAEEPVAEEAAETEAPAEDEAAEEAATRIITDMEGNEVEISTEINTVMNLWPSSTSTMMCLGAGDKLVGIIDYSRTLTWAHFIYPPIADVPTSTDNAEELLALDPDLIISSSNDTVTTLLNANLPAVDLGFDGYETMKQAITIMGDIFGGEFVDKAAAWSKYVDDSIAEVSAAMSGLAEEDKPVVYYISGNSNNGLYSTMNAGEIQNHWVDLAGGIYASEVLALDSGEVSAEAILALNPDVIIIGGQAQHELYDELMADPAWQNINALVNDRVYKNPCGTFGWDRFGAESAMQIKFAASVINPDLFEVDMIEEIKNFYLNFAGVEFTDQHAQYMLDGYGPNGEALILPE